MSASEHLQVRHTMRGTAMRVGGALAGVALALGVQPLAGYAHSRAEAHLDRYSDYFDEAGMTAGLDFNIKPGDEALVQKAHTELDAGTDWQLARVAIEGSAGFLLVACAAGGLMAAKRDETAVAIWHVATAAAPGNN